MSLQTGYLIKANGDGACILYYLTQVDPRGESPRRGGEGAHPELTPWLSITRTPGSGDSPRKKGVPTPALGALQARGASPGAGSASK